MYVIHLLFIIYYCIIVPFPFWEGDSLLFFSCHINHSYLTYYIYNLTYHCFNDLWQLPLLPLLKVSTRPVAWLISERDAVI